jgi:hypothetical protein
LDRVLQCVLDQLWGGVGGWKVKFGSTCNVKVVVDLSPSRSLVSYYYMREPSWVHNKRFADNLSKSMFEPRRCLGWDSLASGDGVRPSFLIELDQLQHDLIL